MKIHSIICIQLSKTSVTASEKMFCHIPRLLGGM
jgi:hypothetical protein